MSAVYQKVPEEELLYINPESGVYFLRKRDGKLDTHISLKTTKIAKARELRNAYQSAIQLRKLGVIPQETESTPAIEQQNETANADDKPKLIQTVGELLDA